MNLLTINALKKITKENPVSASVDGQLQSCIVRSTKSGKPYLEIIIADSIDQFTLKVWESLPQYSSIQKLPVNTFLRLDGDWSQNQYGLEAQNWDFRPLNNSEISDLLVGDSETSLKQKKDWKTIEHLSLNVADPRLLALNRLFIQQYGNKFQSTAAARKNHHARRGGLVEHVAQMMRAAEALTKVYSDLNFDLLISGILFHDAGKMWENSYPESEFTQPYDIQGEMLGHIPLGIDLISRLWQEMMQLHASEWDDLFPLSSEVRIHLLHLIASHHGTYEFGSPTLPRTPEALVLHHLDNIDAKFEMFQQGYHSAPELAPGIQQKHFPLPANLVSPLSHFPKDFNHSSLVREKKKNDTSAEFAATEIEKEANPARSRDDESLQNNRKINHPNTTREPNERIDEINPEIDDDFRSKPFTGELF